MQHRPRRRAIPILGRMLLVVHLVAAGHGVAAADPSPQSTSFVSLGRPVLGPLAYTHFCMRYPAECRGSGDAAAADQPIPLTPSRTAQLDEVNARVNRTITPMRHVGDHSYSTWRLNPRAGDCNDYAVSKRHLLMDLGWPPRALLLSEVVTPWGEHHLVLLARTSAGDLVLDNLDGRIRRWDRSPYDWVRVQMPSEPKLWAVVMSSPGA